MSKKLSRSKDSTPGAHDDRTPFGEFEDAHRSAMDAAAALVEYFEMRATIGGDPDLAEHPHAMRAAFGFREVAERIIEQLDAMRRAADALHRQGSAEGGQQ